MSDFEEFALALPATAVFTVADGRAFYMAITDIDEDGNVQLGAIEGVPKMDRQDFEQLAELAYFDECGRLARRMTRTVQPPLQG